MNISSVDTGGVMTGTSVTAVAPSKMMESSQDFQASQASQVSQAFQVAQTGGGSLSVSQIMQIVDDMQSQIDSMNVSLKYTLYGTHNKNIAVKVVNKDTGEVIREIPPKEMQALQEKMSELVGMIFNDKG